MQLVIILSYLFQLCHAKLTQEVEHITLRVVLALHLFEFSLEDLQCLLKFEADCITCSLRIPIVNSQTSSEPV